MNPYQTVTKDPFDKTRQGISALAAPAQMLNLAMPGLGTAVGAGLNAVALGLPTYTNYTPINPYNTNPHGVVGYRNQGGPLDGAISAFLHAQTGDTQLSKDSFKVNGQGGIDNNFRNVEGNPAFLTQDEVVAKRRNGENYVLSDHIMHPTKGKSLAELGAKNRKRKKTAEERANAGDEISKKTLETIEQEFEELIQTNEQALKVIESTTQLAGNNFFFGGDPTDPKKGLQGQKKDLHNRIVGNINSLAARGVSYDKMMESIDPILLEMDGVHQQFTAMPPTINPNDLNPDPTRHFNYGGLMGGDPEPIKPVFPGGDLAEATVTAKRGPAHPQFSMNTYMEPTEVRARRRFQEEYSLKQTGKLDDQTKRTLLAEGFGTKSGGSTSFDDFNTAKARRSEWQENLRKTGENYGYRKFTMPMDDETMEELKSYDVTGLKTNQCIGGVCNVLNEVDPNTFKHAKNKKKNVYWSNADFEASSAKEGWQLHKNAKVTSPDIGDIIQVQDNGGQHAMLITDTLTDKNGQAQYRVLDNAGVGAARVRYFTKDELDQKYNDGKKNNWRFYRRTQFDDLNTADLARGLPSESFPQFDINREQVAQPDFDIKANEKLPRQARQFIKGLNDINLQDYSNIDPGHLQRIGLISASLMGNESEFGKGLRYTAEKIATTEPTGASRKVMAKYRKDTRNVDSDKSFSTGLTQINADQIPADVKQKHFANRSGRQIEKKIAADPKLAAKVTFDVMVDRYKKLQDNPDMYAQDPEAFWYALIKSWQSPYAATTESGKKAFQTLQTPEQGNNPLSYVESTLNHMNKFSIEHKAMGGKLGDCPHCPKANNYVFGGATELPPNNPWQGVPANQLPYPLNMQSSVGQVPMVTAPRMTLPGSTIRPTMNTYSTTTTPLNTVNPNVTDASGPGLAKSNINPFTDARNQYFGANVWGIPGENVVGVGHPLQYYAQHGIDNQNSPANQNSGRTGARMRSSEAINDPMQSFPFMPGVSAAQVAPQAQQAQQTQPGQPSPQAAAQAATTPAVKRPRTGGAAGSTNYIPGTEELKTGKADGWKGYTTKQYQDWVVKKYGARALPKYGPDGKNGNETDASWKQYGREFLTEMGEFGGVTAPIASGNPLGTPLDQIKREPKLPDGVTSKAEEEKTGNTGDMGRYIGDAMQMLGFAGQLGNMGAVQMESFPRMDLRQIDPTMYEEALRAGRNAQTRNVGSSYTTNQAGQQASQADYMNQLTNTMLQIDTSNKNLAAQTQQYNNQAQTNEQQARLQALAAHQAAKDQVWQNFGGMGAGLNEQYSNKVGSAALASAYPDIYEGLYADILDFLKKR